MTDYLFFWFTEAIGMWPLVPCCQRYSKRHMVATTVHNLVCPVSPCPIDSLLTPLFLLVKRRLIYVYCRLQTIDCQMSGLIFISQQPLGCSFSNRELSKNCSTLGLNHISPIPIRWASVTPVQVVGHIRISLRWVGLSPSESSKWHQRLSSSYVQC